MHRPGHIPAFSGRASGRIRSLGRHSVRVSWRFLAPGRRRPEAGDKRPAPRRTTAVDPAVPLSRAAGETAAVTAVPTAPVARPGRRRPGTAPRRPAADRHRGNRAGKLPARGSPVRAPPEVMADAVEGRANVGETRRVIGVVAQHGTSCRVCQVRSDSGSGPLTTLSRSIYSI